MTIKRFRPRIGRQTLRSSVNETTRQATISARQGMAGIISNYEKFVDHIEGVVPEILLEALSSAFQLSQVYVPKLTGALKDSGYLETKTFRGATVVEIGYGRGGNPDYAAVVHENMSYRHAAPTRAKFLQAALDETEAERYADIIGLLRQAGGV